MPTACRLENEGGQRWRHLPCSDTNTMFAKGRVLCNGDTDELTVPIGYVYFYTAASGPDGTCASSQALQDFTTSNPRLPVQVDDSVAHDLREVPHMVFACFRHDNAGRVKFVGGSPIIELKTMAFAVDGTAFGPESHLRRFKQGGIEREEQYSGMQIFHWPAVFFDEEVKGSNIRETFRNIYALADDGAAAFAARVSHALGDGAEEEDGAEGDLGETSG